MQKEDKTLDILPRKSFYTNKMMVESIGLLKSVVLSTKKVKERVGKKYVEREVLKFNTDQDVIDRILRSYDYYSDPNTEDMKDKRIPTAVISGAVQFRDYQSKIIYDGAFASLALGCVYDGQVGVVDFLVPTSVQIVVLKHLHLLKFQCLVA